MSKAESLQQALKNSSGKTAPTPAPQHVQLPTKKTKPASETKPRYRDGKENIGAFLPPDFGISLRMVQLRRRKDSEGKKIFLDDLMAEALNDLFVKYDVPTVHFSKE